MSVQGRRFDAQSAAHDVASQAISADYLRVTGVPLLAGRNLMPADRADSAAVALVSVQLAKEYFAGGDAIGHTIKLGAPGDMSAPWLTIVGIVGDVKSTSVFREMGYVTMPVVYRPMAQDPGKATTLLVRSEGSTADLSANVQQVVTDVDRDVVLADLRPVDAMLREQNAQPRFRTALLCGFAGMAMLLAALGLYGLLAQRVVERTSEIGIRIALGSTRRRAAGQVAGEALRLVAVGVALGGCASLAAGRALAGLLYETRASDPWLLGAAAAGFAAVALAATAVPAWRASRVEPMVAMRAE